MQVLSESSDTVREEALKDKHDPPAVSWSQLSTDVMEPRLWTQKGTGTPACDADRLVLFCSVLHWGDLVLTLKSATVKLLKEILHGSSTVATRWACIKQSNNHFSSFPTVTPTTLHIWRTVFKHFFWPSLSLVIGTQGTSSGWCPTPPTIGT